jgi:hypothetical protein
LLQMINDVVHVGGPPGMHCVSRSLR